MENMYKDSIEYIVYKKRKKKFIRWLAMTKKMDSRFRGNDRRETPYPHLSPPPSRGRKYKDGDCRAPKAVLAMTEIRRRYVWN